MRISEMRSIPINFTPTGMLPTKALTPHVPVSVQEIVEDVHRATEIGITIAHLHARDEATGAPTYRADVYGRIIEGIRKFADDLILCVSLSGRDFNTFEQRSEALRLTGEVKPDMGSLTLSSLNFNRQASVNAPDMIQALATEMQTRGILPELEAFDAGMVNYGRYLERKGLIEPPHYVNLILGNIACAPADLLHAGILVRDLPDDSVWTMGGVGDAQLPMNMVAIAMGGGVRVGLEDNIWLDPQRTQFATNADFLHRIHALVTAAGTRVTTPGEMRTRLRLLPGEGHYGRTPSPRPE
jgi:3-keto-5-aminohexanoate cleavage enzyme